MEITLIVIGAIFMIGGILGSFLPVIPGPITSWVGLLVLSFTDSAQISTSMLVVTFIIALFIFILDYIIPAIGTKKFGGSKYGVIGTTLGIIVGLFFGPFGIILGPFLGALVGEIIYDYRDINRAVKAAIGSFIGFLSSTFIKFIMAVIYLGIFVWELL